MALVSFCVWLQSRFAFGFGLVLRLASCVWLRSRFEFDSGLVLRLALVSQTLPSSAVPLTASSVALLLSVKVVHILSDRELGSLFASSAFGFGLVLGLTSVSFCVLRSRLVFRLLDYYHFVSFYFFW